jgi:formiminotetrahydrofolate cyclodeaminase
MNGISEQTVGGWLEALASDAPTPGGGAFAGLSAAAGSALISMVGRLTAGKDKFADVDARMRELIAQADGAREEFLRLADKDATAFDGVMAAFKMPKETDLEKAARSAAIQTGYLEAAAVPLECARAAVSLMPVAEESTARGNPQAASDGYSAAVALHAGALCAIANVEINAAALKDERARNDLLDEVATLRSRADSSLAATQTAFALRLSS